MIEIPFCGKKLIVLHHIFVIVHLSIFRSIQSRGYDALRTKYMDAVPSNVLLSNKTNDCGYPRPDSYSLLRDPINSDYPWPGTLIFNIPGDIWFWCTDQVI